MSDDEILEEDNIESDPLIDKVSDYVSTDVIQDLKTGIYNLFVSLLNNLIIEHGIEEAITISTDFLDEISVNFKNVLNTQEK